MSWKTEKEDLFDLSPWKIAIQNVFSRNFNHVIFLIKHLN